MVKIISGYSEKGGSTTAFINLTNIFNENGIDTIFYGPHNWHLDKCKSDLMQKAYINPEDNVIVHFLPIKRKPIAKKTILSCHEKNLFEVGLIKQFWDIAIFLNENHRNYHSKYNGDYRIIPNFKQNNLYKKDKSNLDKIAGVIGSIDRNKQTHISIQRALDDGCEKVLVYGTINDLDFYKKDVEKIIKNPKVTHINFCEDKQKMYDSVGRVYHSSISECACLVKDECYQTNTKFFGTESTSAEVSTLDNQEILKLWKNLLEI
jgi:hypothetical protein